MVVPNMDDGPLNSGDTGDIGESEQDGQTL